MGIRAMGLAACLVGLTASAALAGDITGTWKSEFDTQIGAQKYTFTFVAEDAGLAGTAKASVAGQPERDVELEDVKLEGDAVSFHETFSFQGMDIRIDYTGTLAGDTMTLTRQVGDFATEQIVATRTVVDGTP
jgi:hypothetical protein